MKAVFVMALAIIAIVGLGTAGTAFAAKAVHQSTDVFRFDGVGGSVGTATLVRTNSGVSMTIKSSVEGGMIEFPPIANVFDGVFMPGDAATNWFIVFNNPGNCSGGECGENDILDSLVGGDPNNVMVDVIFATGHVAGSKWRAAAHLNEGDISGSINPLFGAAAIGLIDAMAAEVHLVVRSHGPASLMGPGEVAAAISEVFGACDLFGGPNTCGDAQFAEFAP